MNTFRFDNKKKPSPKPQPKKPLEKQWKLPRERNRPPRKPKN